MSEIASPAPQTEAAEPNLRLMLGKIGALLVVSLFVVIAYTFLHELGHALLGLAFGARLTSFSANFFDLSAHVGLAAHMNSVQQALVSLAGVSLPLLAWLVFILIVPVQSSWTMQWLKLLVSLVVLSSLLAWVAIPLLAASAAGKGAPIADDSAAFVLVSGLPGWLVSLVALSLYLGGMSLAYLRLGKRPGLRRLSLRQPQAQELQKSDRRLLAWLAGLGLFLALLSAGLQAAVAGPGGAGIPPGYELVGEASLTGQPYSHTVLARFEFNQPTSLSLFIRMQNYSSGPAGLELVGPQGYRASIMSAEQSLDAGDATFQPPPFELAPGSYELVLDAHAAKGAVWAYTKE